MRSVAALHCAPPVKPAVFNILFVRSSTHSALNNNHRRQIKRAVLSMKKRARACLANLGGTFEGRRM